MISKELFKQVMGIDYDIDFGFIRGKHVNYIAKELVHSDISEKGKSINTYELAHKCKEWALKNGYTLNIYKKNMCAVDVYTHTRNEVQYRLLEDTEPEAIFKACEWILNDRR